jgi:hypothetical protein
MTKYPGDQTIFSFQYTLFNQENFFLTCDSDWLLNHPFTWNAIFEGDFPNHMEMFMKLPSHSYTTFGLIHSRVNPWYFVCDRIMGKGMKKESGKTESV